MKERPILFSAPMVQAILDGTKIQTRRVVKFPKSRGMIFDGLTGQVQEHHEMKAVWPMPKGGFVWWSSGDVTKEFSDQAYENSDDGIRCPYGEPGDQLWVRETWKCHELESGLDGIRYAADMHFEPIENTQAAADLWIESKRNGKHWRPSIFMPRDYSRITLDVVKVRVERLQAITPEDAWAEGVKMYDDGKEDGPDEWPRSRYRRLWNSINAKRGFGWDVNPWVWVIEFKRIA